MKKKVMRTMGGFRQLVESEMWIITHNNLYFKLNIIPIIYQKESLFLSNRNKTMFINGFYN